jgi:hypothetical protein
MWLDPWYHNWQRQPRMRKVSRTPAPRLEPLEDRTLPSDNVPAAPPPPSTYQAALALYFDAAFLEAWKVAFQNIGPNPDEFGIVPSVTANANAAAAAAGINLDAANHLAGFLENLRGFENGLALANPVSPQTLALQDIQFNWPYAGPFARFALMAGSQAALDRIQQPPT